MHWRGGVATLLLLLVVLALVCVPVSAVRSGSLESRVRARRVSASLQSDDATNAEPDTSSAELSEEDASASPEPEEAVLEEAAEETKKSTTAFPERDEREDSAPNNNDDVHAVAGNSEKYLSRFENKGWQSCANQCLGEKHIQEQLKKGEATPPCCLDLLYDTSSYVDSLLNKHQITTWTMKGSLLGLVREHGIIPHDYDIDMAILFDDINKVAGLRQKIWDDGYVLFQAPWDRYNNMQFVIVKRTDAVQAYFDKHPVPEGALPKFSKQLRRISVAAELMAFKKMNGHMVQVLCTASSPTDGALYDLTLSESLWEDFQADEAAFQRRARKFKKAGWKTYASKDDRTWLSYHERFGKSHASPVCDRTAPSSFRYDAPAKWILPPRRIRFYGRTLSAPRQSKRYLTRYFGKDWRTPKRRYG